MQLLEHAAYTSETCAKEAAWTSLNDRFLVRVEPKDGKYHVYTYEDPRSRSIPLVSLAGIGGTNTITD